MDGWFPCIMPYIEGDERNTYRKYIVTHGKYTIMGSFKTPEEAHTCLARVAEAERAIENPEDLQHEKEAVENLDGDIPTNADTNTSEF